MIPPVLVHPKQKEVLSLEPEFIRPQDGDEKQDSVNHGNHSITSQTDIKRVILSIKTCLRYRYNRLPSLEAY